ncbi:hypothetical protein [Actinomadura rupiterrae]|uniref:hypothetical protein n=1 Tax=Actinomadura rupiterrae TaxID=559627 RepID=UPI0020A26F0B|nr:hypothetical protein [Actinomadura rupiterrae]MCP2337926.1 hypothetical protein [Actinomadura rupiterrae]
MSDAISRSQSALDAYEQQFAMPAGTGSYRESPAVARKLINALLSDLASYADQHQLSLDPAQIAALARSRASVYTPEFEHPANLGWQVDEAVEVIPRSGSFPPTRGYIADLHHAADGSLECTVAFPGVPAPVRIQASRLRSTAPFPGVSLGSVEVTRPSEAMRRLVAATARRLHGSASPCDLTDETLLGTALADWAGVSATRVRESLRHPIMQAAAEISTGSMNAAQLAASGLPSSPFWAQTPPAVPHPRREPPPRPRPRP